MLLDEGLFAQLVMLKHQEGHRVILFIGTLDNIEQQQRQQQQQQRCETRERWTLHFFLYIFKVGCKRDVYHSNIGYFQVLKKMTDN